MLGKVPTGCLGWPRVIPGVKGTDVVNAGAFCRLDTPTPALDSCVAKESLCAGDVAGRGEVGWDVVDEAGWLATPPCAQPGCHRAQHPSARPARVSVSLDRHAHF